MAKITGFDSIETGSGPVQPGKDYSVAELIDIVTEIRHSIDQIDIQSILNFLAIIPEVNGHLDNLIIHLTQEQKDTLIEIINDYESGLLTGGTGGTGGGATVYADRVSLLATTGTLGAMAILATESSNLYIWNTTHNKWAVIDGNVYSTLLDLPDEISFYIPAGTILIIESTGERALQV